jgi:hypothetical protein
MANGQKELIRRSSQMGGPLCNSGAAMTTQRCAVIIMMILTLVSSSGLGFAAGNERGNRSLEQQTIQRPNGTSIRILRGRPSSPASVEQSAPPTVPRAEPWVVGGDRLWMVDPQQNKITVCSLKRTSYVGEKYIECLARRGNQ